MDSIIIAAIITGSLGFLGVVLTVIVTICLERKNRKSNSSNIKYKSHTKVSSLKYPEFLNPNEYEIEEEGYFVTLAALLQHDSSEREVSVRKINETTKKGDRDE